MTKTIASISVLLAACRLAQANPDALFATESWTDPVWNVPQFRTWLSRCIDAKINRHDPRLKWRKFQDGYHADLRCDARMVNEYMGLRHRHSGSQQLLRTDEMKRRYPHVNNQPFER